MALLYRNTDRDWQQIGENHPFWGVLTMPEFRQDALTSESLEAFYSSGRDHVEWLSGEVQRVFQTPLTSANALDFGCGVGRVTHAMTAVADHVTGMDISSGMLSQARKRENSKASFVDRLGNDRFDWLHSFIVFQHIPPARGLVILKDLLARLTPGGWATLHFTVARTDLHRGKTALARLKQWVRHRLLPDNRVSMFDYDLGKLVKTFHAAGIRQMTFLPTDHGGHLGVFIIGRREAAQCN